MNSIILTIRLVKLSGREQSNIGNNIANERSYDKPPQDHRGTRRDFCDRFKFLFDLESYGRNSGR